MKRKLKNLTEQFTDARTNYDKILGRSDKQLINEQSGNIRVRVKGCNGGMQQYKCAPPGTVQGHRYRAQVGQPHPGTWREVYVKTILGGTCSGIELDPATMSAPCPNCDNESFDCVDPSTTSCDTTPASSCATQWFQNPNATWAANWINNRDCSNYTWPSIHLVQQANNIMTNAPTPQMGPYNDASDIWAAGNASGLPTSPINLKAEFIAKMAKGQYSLCQKQACNC